MIYGCIVGRKNLFRVVTTATHFPNLVACKVAHHIEQFGIGSEELLTHVFAIGNREFLRFPIHNFAHTFYQFSFAVFFQNRIPVATPEYFNYIPACTTEYSFEFLHNFSVTTHRTVETLQVTVNHKNQIIQFLTGS